MFHQTKCCVKMNENVNKEKKMHECIHKSNFALGQRHGRDRWVGFQKARQRAIKTHWERKEGL